MMVGNEHQHTIGGEAVRQWRIIMADSSIGLLTSDCTMCRPAKRPIVLAVHLQHATRGLGPHLLNAIFDTG
jgi:hypothetical protein